MPTGPDDEESRLLYELDAFVGSSPAFRGAELLVLRQAALYQHVLGPGAARGAFELAAPAESLARGIVAMEDGLGLQVVVGHPGSTARRPSGFWCARERGYGRGLRAGAIEP